MQFSFAPARVVLAVGVFLASRLRMDASAQDRHGSERQEMLDEISRMARETRWETGRAEFSVRVMEAISRVDRHRLVPDDERGNVYRNRPLGIGLGQTISQPFIVALMTDLLDVQPGEKVLEVGTGSGYQAAWYSRSWEPTCTRSRFSNRSAGKQPHG